MIHPVKRQNIGFSSCQSEKIEWLLDHPEDRKKMGQFGYKRVREELHWGVEAPKYLQVYETLFKGN